MSIVKNLLLTIKQIIMKLLKLVFILCFLFSNPQLNAQDSCNCCTEKHNQFNFWEGQWEVKDEKGKTLGYSTISFVQNHCVLKEEWSNSTSAYTGTSYNFYNSKSNRWEQLWLDNQGEVLKLSGQFLDGKMILTSQTANYETQQEEKVNRITWTPLQDGRVKQEWNTISANGEATLIFKGFYEKLKR